VNGPVPGSSAPSHPARSDRTNGVDCHIGAREEGADSGGSGGDAGRLTPGVLPEQAGAEQACQTEQAADREGPQSNAAGAVIVTPGIAGNAVMSRSRSGLSMTAVAAAADV
jgi:hypothetical protein